MRRALIWFALLAPLPAAAGTLRGTIELPSEAGSVGRRPLAYWRVENGVLPIASAGPGQHGWAVAVLEPTRPADAAPTRMLVEMRARQFEPKLLIVSAGSTIEFRNSDRGARMIYLQDGETFMPRDAVGVGRSREVKFTVPGEYRVRDVYNPHASVTIVVVASPYIASADERGVFHIDAPDGRYTLRVFARGTWASPQAVNLLGSGSAVVRITATDGARGGLRGRR